MTTNTMQEALFILTIIATILVALLIEGITHTTHQILTRETRRKEEYIQIMRYIISNKHD